MENYQGAAKLAALDRHYHLALAYQLKALALATLEFSFDAEKHSQNHCSNLKEETDEKNPSSDRAFTKSSNESTDHGASSCSLNEDKMRSTDFSNVSNMTNTAKDKNSNSLKRNYSEQFKAHVTNVNSSCVPVPQLGGSRYSRNGSTNNRTEVNENTVNNRNMVNEIANTEVTVNLSSCTESRAMYVEDMGDTAANRIKSDSLVSGTGGAEENVLNIGDQSDMMTVPQNSDYENKVVKESKTGEGSESNTHIENKNRINSRIDFLYCPENKCETNQFVEDGIAPKEKSKAECSERICVQPTDLEPNSELPLLQCGTGVTKTESDKQESLQLEDSKQETHLLAKPWNHLSSKTHVSPVEEEVETSSSVSTPESISTNVNNSEMHAFAVQGGTEQMSEQHHLTSPDSSVSPLVSEEQGVMSPEPFIPHANEQSSQDTGVNLISINENGHFQNQLISLEAVEGNPKRCEQELTNNLTPLLNSYTSSAGNCELFVEVKQEAVLSNSDMDAGYLSAGARLQNNCDAVTPAAESKTVARVNDSNEKEGVSNEENKMENQTDGVYDQGNTAENQLIVTSDPSDGTAGKVYAPNKTCNDPHKIFENKDVFDAEDCRQVMKSDCSKFQQMLDLSIEIPCARDSYNSHTDSSVAEEKLTSCSKKDTKNNAVKTPSTPTEIDSGATVRASEINVSSTKKLSSDKVDLENCKNEFKFSCSDRDFHPSEMALDDEVSIKSPEPVTLDIFNNALSANMQPEQTGFISVSTASDTAPSKMMPGNRMQQANSTDESKTTDTCKDIVSQAAAVVEYYVSVMEEDSHAMMRRLLQQVCLLHTN